MNMPQQLPRSLVDTPPSLSFTTTLWRRYSTEEEREVVAGGGVPGVKSLGLAQMCELLRWGIVMGVDDGCEPTAEEVEEGVAGRQAQQR